MTVRISFDLLYCCYYIKDNLIFKLFFLMVVMTVTFYSVTMVMQNESESRAIHMNIDDR